MLLNELEPGTVFTLTPEALKLAKAEAKDRYFKGGYYGNEITRAVANVTAGPFRVDYPSRLENGRQVPPSLIPVNEATPYSYFVPQADSKYEVEVQPSRIGAETDHLPNRGWIITSADPEVFIERNGKVIPGFMLLPSKKEPITVAEGGTTSTYNGVFHEDGFAAEFSPAPVQCHEYVVGNISTTLKGMLTYLNSKLTKAEFTEAPYTISDKSFIEMTPELLASGTDKQVSLGCDTSENIWGHTPFTSDEPRKFPFRMAGGHIHLGKVENAKWFHQRAERIIKAMDVFCAVPSVALLAGIDDPRRREFYGRAGEFRFQKHGLEYRVLSNAWLRNPGLTHLVLNLARGAFRFGTMDWESMFKFDPELIRHIINDNDVPAARKFVEENSKLLIWMLNKDNGHGVGAKGLSIIHGGARKYFKDSLSIEKSWFDKPWVYGTKTFKQFVNDKAVENWGDKPVEEKTVTPTPRRATIDLNALNPVINARQALAQARELDIAARQAAALAAAQQRGLYADMDVALNQFQAEVAQTANANEIRTVNWWGNQAVREVTERDLDPVPPAAPVVVGRWTFADENEGA